MERESIFPALLKFVSTGENTESFLNDETTIVEHLLDQFELPRSKRTTHIHCARQDNLETLKDYILNSASKSDLLIVKAIVKE